MDRRIDFRSDTSTKPTPAMRQAMTRAEVGDDVYDEDPTIHQLQDRVAAYFGVEGALFVPSGTMSNQIAIKCHTQPCDEILCETTNHIYVWEAGAPAVLSGVTCRIIDGVDGILEVDQLRDKIRPKNEHYAQTRLVCLENTHNRGGGRIYPIEKIAAISAWARHHGLAMHLDGARIWNAIIASGIPGAEWAKYFDTISVCFSKGLGAPVGSALLGTKTFLTQARRIRKLFGGAMRQGGIIAAGALFAFQEQFHRLQEDHVHAQLIATGIRSNPLFRLTPPIVETNLVWFEVVHKAVSAHEVGEYLKQRNILCHIAGPRLLRICTHLDVSLADCQYTADALSTCSLEDLTTIQRRADETHY